MAISKNQTYEKDFYAWTLHNAELIHEGRFSEVDFQHIAEELESMGRSDKRALINRFAILLAHLLKWQFQPDRRSNSWKYTIEEQRFEVLELLEDSPSLNHELENKLSHAYEKALLIAAKETGMSLSTFPQQCPFSLKKALDKSFYPKD